MKIKGRDYPDNWPAIAHSIKFDRAGGRCEACGVPHHALILRSDVDSSRWLMCGPGRWTDYRGIEYSVSDVPDEYADDEDYTRVILTTHHIGVDKPDGTPGDPHDKMDCRPENLAALCQRCHLLADLPNHLAARHQTWLKKRHGAQTDAGQLVMFEGGDE